jgi:hypothetical protein|tara:strand:+ start:7165 stop:7461 length:297 start_codon:yes stop_codon:yes gene_type:complete
VNTWYVKTEVRTSTIEGQGRYTISEIAINQKVLYIEGNIYKNENNSYVNHSSDNNLTWDGLNGWVSNRVIKEGDELTMNYREWIKIEVSDDHWLNRTY